MYLIIVVLPLRIMENVVLLQEYHLINQQNPCYETDLSCFKMSPSLTKLVFRWSEAGLPN